MENALIVASSDKGNNSLSELLREEAIRNITHVSNGGEARRILLDKEFELVIISAPLSAASGHEFACWITESTAAGVILLVHRE